MLVITRGSKSAQIVDQGFPLKSPKPIKTIKLVNNKEKIVVKTCVRVRSSLTLYIAILDKVIPTIMKSRLLPNITALRIAIDVVPINPILASNNIVRVIAETVRNRK